MMREVNLRTLRALSSEYSQLRSLEGHTSQSRGQRLNSLLSEMFGAWGDRARADLNARGNIDVAFAIDEQRFILEAKWEQSPIATGPITKLQKRVRQRLAGTIGVFVSMSGYTADALADVKDGERLEVLLLDNQHVEAMLTGFCPPAELFNLMLDRAHFYGDPTASLGVLLNTQLTTVEVQVGPNALEQEALRAGVNGTAANWVAAGLPHGKVGVSTFSDGRLLLTTGAGLLVLDPPAGPSQRWLGCDGAADAKVLSQGDIAVVRGLGVGVIGDAGISVRGGPFGGRVAFAKNAGDDLVIFTNDPEGSGPSGYVSHPAALATLGDEVGDVDMLQLDPASQGAGATLLDDGRILVVGTPTVLFDSTGEHRQFQLNVINPCAAVPALRDGHVLVTGGDVELVLLELDTGVATSLGAFNLSGSAVDLAMIPGSRTAGYVYAHHQVGTALLGAVVQFDLQNDQG